MNQPENTCLIDGCERSPRARGWCFRHYSRWRRYGDPLGGGPHHDFDDLSARFWRKVDRTAGCWNWAGAVDRDGYGTFGRHSAAHRYAYELNNGPLPADALVDHICHNPRCVRPSHLRLATQKQNQENLSGVRSDSTTGIRGVCWEPRYRKWRVQVGHHGRRIHVGYFDDIAEAAEAARLKRIELFTHNEIDRNRVSL